MIFNFPPRTEEYFGWYCVLLAIIFILPGCILTYIIQYPQINMGIVGAIVLCLWGFPLLWLTR